MVEYAFVRCPARFERSVPSIEPIRSAVEEHAQAGWRLVQVVVLNPAAVPEHYDLIFERTGGTP
jgi:hypothetical protein